MIIRKKHRQGVDEGGLKMPESDFDTNILPVVPKLETPEQPKRISEDTKAIIKGLDKIAKELNTLNRVLKSRR